MINDPIVQDLSISDAEIAAQWSIDAVRAGRAELAEALLRIAAQAVRSTPPHPRASKVVPVVDVPFVGATRDETPRPKLRVATYGPTGNGDADLQRESADLASTAVMAAPNAIDRRCSFQVVKGNHYQPCHGATYWIPGSIGDASTPATVGRWEHVDDELNQDHHAFVEG